MKKYTVLCTKLFLLFAIVALCSCSFHVFSPRPGENAATVNGFTVTPSSQIQIPVVFTDPVDPATVVVGKTLLLKFTKNANEGASLSWSADYKTLTILTNDKVSDLMQFHPDDGFSLTLTGTDTGNGVVKSKTGTVLDGDGDNNSGGNYVKGFRIIG